MEIFLREMRALKSFILGGFGYMYYVFCLLIINELALEYLCMFMAIPINLMLAGMPKHHN